MNSSVNQATQNFSQTTQKSFYNDSNGFKMDTKALGEFIAKVMDDNDLTARKVADVAGFGVSYSQVNKIKNGDVEDPGVGTLQAIARGLRVSEELLFAIARGRSPDGELIANERFARISHYFGKLPESEREKFELLLGYFEAALYASEKKSVPHKQTAKPQIAEKVMTFDEAKADNDRQHGRVEEEKNPK